MLRVEFHCHTIFSPDSLTTPQQLIMACQRRSIDRVVVTDHNTIQGALIAHEIDPQRVIIGEEIMTTKGELLAAFVQEKIPAGLDPHQALKLLRDQGAYISVSHPFDRWRSGHWEMPDLLEILPYIDAIETFNARCILREFNQQAVLFAHQHNLPGTAGSDAHSRIEIGKATFSVAQIGNADQLRNSIRNATFHCAYSTPLIHLTSRYAVIRKRLGRVRRRPLKPS